jgi:hypothetical protein
MCRNIKTLFNFYPPATDEEIRAASLQFVRKLSGFRKPSIANEAAFDRATHDIAATARRLLDSLVTQSPPRDRELEAAKARARDRTVWASTLGSSRQFPWPRQISARLRGNTWQCYGYSSNSRFGSDCLIGLPRSIPGR